MTNTVSKTVSDEELNAIMWIESSGNPNARAATSSAEGLGQFLKGTWRDTVKKYRPDVFKTKTDAELLAMRRGNPSFMIEMLARFTENNRRIIGPRATLGDLYLAHFLGVDDAKKLYDAPMGMPVSQFLGSGPINANPKILRGKTAGEVRKWAESKMRTASKKADNYVARYYRKEAAVAGLLEPVVTERPGISPNGDPRLYDNQAQLKSMNYNPGKLDGLWGGGTAGAIAGFINDRDPTVPVPTTWQAYDANYEQIDALIDQGEIDRFRRPVTRKRAEADPELVERVAPEVVPAKRTLWTSIAAFFSAFGTAVYQFMDWLFGWKDKADGWGLTDYLGMVPPFVWILLGAGVFGFLIYTTIRTVRGIERPVTTGERL